MIEEKDEFKLKRLGITDSKLLTPKKREALFDKIKDNYSHKIITVDCAEIDDAVNGKDSLNLNWLEARKAAEIINYMKPDVVYLDCPSTNIKAFTEYVRELLDNKDVKIISEHKADLKYVVVGAASILAKVVRDRRIVEIERVIKKKIGSGYPSDPKTKEFLEKNYKKHPEFIRKSWASYQNLIKKKGQSRLDTF